jgi:hypothetical protein
MRSIISAIFKKQTEKKERKERKEKKGGKKGRKDNWKRRNCISSVQ